MKAVQSAMAIRRQRHRREEAVRAKNRRSSHQSDHLMLSESGSQLSLDGQIARSSVRHQKVMGGVTTFHVGVVFLFMGILLLISGLVPGYTNRQYWDSSNANNQSGNAKQDNKRAPLLLGTGSFLVLAGVLLIVAHRIASRKEEEQFSRYITRKLAPAKISTHHQQPIAARKDEAASAQEDENEDVAVNGDPAAAQCQSPSQLECIIEETEGSEKHAPKDHNKDQLHWTSEVAPVHHQQQGESKHKHHHHHHHPHHESSTG